MPYGTTHHSQPVEPLPKPPLAASPRKKFLSVQGLGHRPGAVGPENPAHRSLARVQHSRPRDHRFPICSFST